MTMADALSPAWPPAAELAQLWGVLGNRFASGPCSSPHPPLPGSGSRCGYPKAKQKGSPRLLLRATRASSAYSSRPVSAALSRVRQTVVCILMFKPPDILGPR